jgi:alkaline phosphatase
MRDGSTDATPAAVASHTLPSRRRIADGAELPFACALGKPSVSV